MPEEAVIEQEGTVTSQDEGGTPASSVAGESAPVDTKALESSVAALLGKAFNEPVEEAPADEEVSEETPAGEEQTGEEPAAQEEQEQVAEAAAKPAPVTVNTGTTPTLPAPIRRSLIARGYTEADIDTDLKTHGLKFVEMAERVHRGRTAEVNEWAAAGRQARANPAQTQQQTQQQPTNGVLPTLDAAKLKEKHGDDKLIDDLVGPINAAIAKINAQNELVQKSHQQSEVATQETLIRQIDAFFGSKDLEPYKQVYGDNTGLVNNPKGQEARNKVLELADALTAGAKLQGRSLTLGEALTLAHDACSGEYKIQAARTQVRQQLQQRNRGISMKPQGRGNNPAGYNGTKSSTERKVGDLLAKAFK